MSADALRARVLAWAEYDRLVKASDAAEDDDRDIDERHAAVEAFDAHGFVAEATGPRPSATELLQLALRLFELEKAILSSAGDAAQREAAIDAVVAVNFEPAHRPSRKLAFAYLAQGKALADLRFVVLKLDDVLTAIAHTEDCGHYACTDPDECQHGAEGDRSLCNDVGIPCSCGVVGAIELIKLARGEAGEKVGG